MKKNLLKTLRGNKSQLEIAKEYGVSQQCWQSWETGRTVPDNATMLRMENNFGVPMEHIFTKASRFVRLRIKSSKTVALY